MQSEHHHGSFQLLRMTFYFLSLLTVLSLTCLCLHTNFPSWYPPKKPSGPQGNGTMRKKLWSALLYFNIPQAPLAPPLFPFVQITRTKMTNGRNSFSWNINYYNEVKANSAPQFYPTPPQPWSHGAGRFNDPFSSQRMWPSFCFSWNLACALADCRVMRFKI